MRLGLSIMLLLAAAHGAVAATVDPPADPPPDAAPCVAAIAAGDDDRTVAVCGLLIDHEKTLPADRLKALVARAAILARRNQGDRAIADYDVALRLDPKRADLFAARGELWRGKGDRPRAVRDFAAAIKLDPQNETARASHKALSLEIEKIGADMALKNVGKAQAKPGRGAAP